MKTTIRIAILIATVLCALTLGNYQASGKAKVETITIEVEKPDILSFRQRAWLGALQWCESRGNPKALNANDRDNTPSYGILQFKPGTFYGFGKLYGIDTKAGYNDPTTQIKIVEQMIIRNDVKWSQQFPDCTKQLGVPPRN